MTPTKPCLWTLALVPVLAIPGLANAQTCANASDCGQAMICHSQASTSCSGGTAVAVPCAPNTVCPTPSPASDPVCTATFQCVYPWQLPCNADVDCGDGFVCQPTPMGMCSGSAPVAGGGTAPAPVCVTTSSFPGSCQAKVASCSSDADCPSVWKCVDTTAPTTVSSGPTAMDAGVLPTPPPAATATTTATATTSRTCQAPNANPGRSDGVGGAQPTLNGGSSPDGGATTKGTTTPPTMVATGPDASSATPSAAIKTGGGCSLGRGTPSSGLTILGGVLGILGLLRRRRSCG